MGTVIHPSIIRLSHTAGKSKTNSSVLGGQGLARVKCKDVIVDKYEICMHELLTDILHICIIIYIYISCTCTANKLWSICRCFLGGATSSDIISEATPVGHPHCFACETSKKKGPKWPKSSKLIQNQFLFKSCFDYHGLHFFPCYMKICSSGGCVILEAKTPEDSMLDNSSSRGPELLGP